MYTLAEDELSHKGIDKAAVVDRGIIEGNDYRRKFDNCTDNAVVNKVLYEIAKDLLYSRSGTRYESMYWIDGDTGEIITKFDSMGRVKELTGADHELKVEYSERLLRKLKGHNNVVVIHNHPNSTAPSAGDFNSAYLHGYNLGFVVTHDGRVFKYASNQKISSEFYAYSWSTYCDEGYDEVEAQIKTINNIARNSDIYVEEVMRK